MSLKSYPLELHNMNMLLKNLVRMHNGSMPIGGADIFLDQLSFNVRY